MVKVCAAAPTDPKSHRTRPGQRRSQDGECRVGGSRRMG